MAQKPLNPGIRRQPSAEALRRALLEIAESAILGCLEPRPISSSHEQELPHVRRAIVHARDGRLSRFPWQVNRNAPYCSVVSTMPAGRPWSISS